MKNKKLRRFIIEEKDFKKYGIKSHYELSVKLDKNFKVEDTASVSTTKKGTGKTIAKGVSKIGGDLTGRIVEGYASTFDKDRVNDVITTEAMTEAIDDLLKQGSNTVFYDHDTSRPIGRVLETKLDSIGLFIKVMISKATDVEDYWIKIKEKILNSFSIRLRPKKVEVIQNKETGRIEKYNILSMELFEVSIVGIPCNPFAAVTSVVEKSFKHSIRKLNSKTRGSEMKIKKVIPSAKTPAPAPAAVVAKGAKSSSITKKEVLGLLQKNNATMLKSIEGMLQKSAKPVKSKKAPAKASAKPVVKANGKTKAPAQNTELKSLFEGLNASIATLGKKFATGQRKGFTADDGGAVDTTPKKVLKSATDADTVKFVVYASNNEDVYKALTADEKHKVKGIYIQLADVSSAAD